MGGDFIATIHACRVLNGRFHLFGPPAPTGFYRPIRSSAAACLCQDHHGTCCHGHGFSLREQHVTFYSYRRGDLEALIECLERDTDGRPRVMKCGPDHRVILRGHLSNGLSFVWSLAQFLCGGLNHCQFSPPSKGFPSPAREECRPRLLYNFMLRDDRSRS